MKNLLNSIKIMDSHNFCLTTNLLEHDIAKELIEHYPTENFTTSIRDSGDKKHYFLNILPVIEDDVETLQYANLSLVWHNFISQITDPAYINTILQFAQILSVPYYIKVGFYTFSDGGWISPHIDNPGKIFTQIFYFNSFWDINWGGKLVILKSNDPKDIIISVPPLVDYTATIFRSNNAWHMVEPVIPQKNLKRLSLQLEVIEKIA
jgi:Rps23 Pro-64 3,4-dihydroxylase Tpa1-like proline 4-hydroxylase